MIDRKRVLEAEGESPGYIHNLMESLDEEPKILQTWMFENPYPNVEINREPVRSSKVGRNEPCPCGSGRKYKKCCGK